MATTGTTAESRDLVAVGDRVLYARDHKAGATPDKLEATGTVTLIAYGPPGQRMIEIDDHFLRLETEVKQA